MMSCKPIKIIITILFFSFFSMVYSQSNSKFDRIKIYVNSKDISIKATVISPNIEKIKIENDKSYFWYSNNQIFQTNGGYDGKLLDGEFTSYYHDTNLKEKGNFKLGLKDGEWKSWHQNGKLNECIQWKKGHKNGLYKMFNNNGELILTTIYKNDKINGKEIRYEYGTIISKKSFNVLAERVGFEPTVPF
jgi:antitoxin component YwqK of YwqJK toxin-antitoxin module